MLCVPIYNIKLAMMQKTTIFTTFSAHTKMNTEKRGQDEVFGRNTTKHYIYTLYPLYIHYISPIKHYWDDDLEDREHHEETLGDCRRCRDLDLPGVRTNWRFGAALTDKNEGKSWKMLI